MLATTALMMSLGAMIAMTAVWAAIRPMTKGNPYYV
jgi:hypothetical protein